eukprot:g18397.t1
MSGGISGQIFVAAVTLLMGGLNFAGLSIVGWVAFLLAGLTDNQCGPIIGALRNCLFWNLNYWDTASTLAGEVQDVSTTYPKALGVAMVAVVLSYFLPLLVGLGISGATSDWRNWQDGEFALMGRRLGGSILESWVITGAAVSCLGQQLSEMAEAAFQLQGMAEDGWLPTCFAHRSRFDTPSLPLAVITVLVLVLSVFSSFNAIINMLNSVYCVAQVIEFSAFLHLRRKHDDLERPSPFRVPCRSLAACCLLLLMPFAFCLVLLVMPFEIGFKSPHCWAPSCWVFFSTISWNFPGDPWPVSPSQVTSRRWLTFYRCPPGGLEDILAQRPNESLWALGPKDEQILSQTLTSLAQAHGAQSFHVVLAMEEWHRNEGLFVCFSMFFLNTWMPCRLQAREGDPAVKKANQLSEEFGKHFATLRRTSHPENLRQVHMDGSWDPEIPGKASNLKQDGLDD